MSDVPSQPAPRTEAEIFADLALLCGSPGYAEAIATICARDNIIQIGEGISGETLAPMFSQDRLIRTEIATLVGLLARQPSDDTSPAPDIVSRYVADTEALLLELHDALSRPWRAGLQEILAGESTDHPFNTGDAMREPVFYSGESAYSFQYRDFAAHRYSADDGWLRANRGFDIDAACKVVAAVGRLQVRKILAVMDARTAGGSGAAPFLPAFTFTADEVAATIGMEPARVEPVLQAFALPTEDRNARFEKLQDFNATNATPLLRLWGGRFLLFHIYSLDEALYESPTFWMSADRAYASTAAKNRGAFPERFTRQRLRDVFGPAAVHANVLLPDGRTARHGEIDVLVIFGDHAIVVQNKSKRLTIEARQGNESQIRDDFKKAVQDATNQARVCAERLLDTAVALTDLDGRPIRLAKPIRRVFPVCLVADHYPALAAQVRQFLTWAPAERISAPLVTDLFTLDAMAEILSSPLRFLSYLDLRARFGDRVLFNHELTLLGYHLSQNLRIDDDVDSILLDDGLSANLEAAMVVRREGLPGARTPKGILPTSPDTLSAKLIAQFEENPAAVELGLRLMQLSGQSMQVLVDGIAKIAAAARRDGGRHDFGMGFGDAGLTIHANSAPPAVARDFLYKHCTIKKHQQKTSAWYGLLIDPASGKLRDGLQLNYPWEPDDLLENAAGGLLARPMPAMNVSSMAIPKPARNAPCPCGSRKKWKVCCRP